MCLVDLERVIPRVEGLRLFCQISEVHLVGAAAFILLRNHMLFSATMHVGPWGFIVASLHLLTCLVIAVLQASSFLHFVAFLMGTVAPPSTVLGLLIILSI